MNRKSIRADWQEFRQSVDMAARDAKSSQDALLKLSDRYASLGAEEREIVDGLISDWVLSADEGERFDGVALVSEHSIRLALPALQRLATRLATDSSPGAPYERAKVIRVIRRLRGLSG
jgi:hypothetical protein